MKHFHSTLMAKGHKMTINDSNKFIDSTINEAKTLMKGYGVSNSATAGSPLPAVADGIYDDLTQLGENLKSVNSDTTITADSTILKQSDIVIESVKSTFTRTNLVEADIKGMIKQVESTLFSSAMVVDDNVNALLGNSTILEEMRKDFAPYAESESMARLLNTFNKYGVIGDEKKQSRIAGYLNNKYTPDAVSKLADTKAQLTMLGEVEAKLSKMYNYLTADSSKVVGLRKMKVQ